MSTVNPPRPAQPLDPRSGPRGILCPYCGQVSLNPKRCDACSGYFDPLSRQASQNSMGPWYIRSIKAPFRPGCSLETIRDLVKKGKIVKETVIRGPTTRQFWNFAGRTPGVANLLGVCHNCGSDVSPEAFSCASCGAAFTPETDRQHLGLAPVHLLPGQASPEIIAASSGAPAKPVRRAVVAKAVVAEVVVVPKERRPWVRWALIGAAVVFVGGSIAVAVFMDDIRQIVDDLLGRTPAPAAPAAAPSGPVATPAVPADAPKPEQAPKTTPPPPVAKEPVKEQPAAAEGVDELGAVRATLAAGGEFDQKALLDRLERIKAKKPSAAAEVDALVELVKKRAEQERLKKLPG